MCLSSVKVSLNCSCNRGSLGQVDIWYRGVLSKLRGVSTADVSVKVAAAVTGEVAVWTGMGPNTSVGQHVTLLIGLSDECAPTSTAQEPHLQEKTRLSLQVV